MAPSAGGLLLFLVLQCAVPAVACVMLGLRKRELRSDALTRGTARAELGTLDEAGVPADGKSWREDVRRDSEPQNPLTTAKSAARIISGVMADAMAAFSTLR